MKKLSTEILIEASPEEVWKVLTDFDRYPEWNPFITSISGKLKPRERLKVNIVPPGEKGTIFKPRVNHLKSAEIFSWVGHLFIVGLFDGHHIFELHQTEIGQTRFVHSEEFGGILVTFLWKKLQTSVRDGFEQMNEALKTRVENYT